MKLFSFWEKLRYGLWFYPESFFTKEHFQEMQMRENRPRIEAAKRALKQYRETKDEKYNEEAVMILLRFRVVMTDYRFEKLLKELSVTKESAINAMASVLNFTPAKKEKQSA
jgi:hypothetical protein